MPQDTDKTATYSATHPTAAPDPQSLSVTTSSYAEPSAAGFASKTHGIGVGDDIYLHQRKLKVNGIISAGTSEAIIYRVEDDLRNSLAVKLYFEFNNPMEEPNGETLERIKGIDDPDILRLHDFGVGADKYLGKYCFEICDFAEGGDLFSVENLRTHYTLDHLQRVLIPEIFSGIRKLHSYRIYHCDLKPWNVLYLDGDRTNIVIGDYGSGKVFDMTAEQDIRKTSTVKGTEIYLAPEQSRGIISEKNDYYSFGIILLHLLYPESIAHDNDFRRASKQKFERIVERQYNSMPIIDFDPRWRRVNTLIEGLTLLNHVNRWGRTEVESWLRGEDHEVKYRVSDSGNIHPVKLGYATINSAKDLIYVLETYPTAYDDLIEDPDTYTTVKSWIDSYRDIPTRKAFDKMVRFYQPQGREYVREAVLRFFQPERSITIDTVSFKFFAAVDIHKEVEAFVAQLDKIWKFTPLQKLRFYLFQLEFSLRQLEQGDRHDTASIRTLVKKLYSAFALVAGSFDAFTTEIPRAFSRYRINRIDPATEEDSLRLLLNLFYTFNPSRGFRDQTNRSINTLRELALFFLQNESLFTDKFIVAEKNYFLDRIGNNRLINEEYLSFVFGVFTPEKTILADSAEVRQADYASIHEVAQPLLKALKNKERQRAESAIEHLKNAKATAEKVGAASQLSEVTRALGEFEAELQKNDVFVYRELVPEIKSWPEKTFVIAERAIEKQIERKYHQANQLEKQRAEEITELQTSISKLEAERGSLESTFKRWNAGWGSYVLMGIGWLLLFQVLAGLIKVILPWFATGDRRIAENEIGRFMAICVVLFSCASCFAVPRIYNRITYKNRVVNPQIELSRTISKRQHEIPMLTRAIEETCAKARGTLNSEIEELKGYWAKIKSRQCL